MATTLVRRLLIPTDAPERVSTAPADTDSASSRAGRCVAFCNTPEVPELPEVETIRRQLEPRVVGRRITSAWGFDSPKFSGAVLARGATVQGIRRRGKYLLAGLGGGRRDTDELVIHLGMTGRLAVCDEGDEPPDCNESHLRARWTLDDGSYLGFWDPRRFGRATVVADRDYADLPTLARLGPEPFSEQFTPDSLRNGLSGRKALKTALMDQRIVAGIGNIYADEALWESGIRPTTRRLGAARAASLHEAIVAVLDRAVSDGGTTLRDYRDASGSQGSHQSRLRCYGRAGLPCPRCDRPLSHTVLDARGTTWCKHCQT